MTIALLYVAMLLLVAAFLCYGIVHPERFVRSHQDPLVQQAERTAVRDAEHPQPAPQADRVALP